MKGLRNSGSGTFAFLIEEAKGEVAIPAEAYSGGALPGRTSGIALIERLSKVPDTVRTVIVRSADGGHAVGAAVRPES